MKTCSDHRGPIHSHAELNPRGLLSTVARLSASLFALGLALAASGCMTARSMSPELAREISSGQRPADPAAPVVADEAAIEGAESAEADDVVGTADPGDPGEAEGFELSAEAQAALENAILEADREMEDDGDRRGPSRIPLEINQAVRKWLHYFTVKDRDRFQRFLNNGIYYRDEMQKILKAHGVPKEFYYLGMIESGFYTRARSRVGATGAWQFMQATGRNYGLRVDWSVDERRDPMRATHAAAKYLKDLYNVFQNWYLAMSAYNAGEVRILRAIMRGKTRDFWELADQRRLPRETMNYVPKFLAAAIIGHHPEKFGFVHGAPEQERMPEISQAIVPGGSRLADFAKLVGVDYKLLERLNPHVERGVVPGYKKEYEIWIPKTFEDTVSAKSAEIAKLTVVPGGRYAGGGKYHRVRRGENLSAIARRYGVSVGYLRKLNGMSSNRIYAGRRIMVSPRADRRTASRVATGYHRVRRGENLHTIARRYGMSVRDLKQLNGMRSNRIYAGRKVRVAKRGGSSGSVKYYRVRRGDNLATIAKRFGVSIAELKRMNKLRRNTIYAGQSLKVASNI